MVINSFHVWTKTVAMIDQNHSEQLKSQTIWSQRQQSWWIFITEEFFFIYLLCKYDYIYMAVLQMCSLITLHKKSFKTHNLDKIEWKLGHIHAFIAGWHCFTESENCFCIHRIYAGGDQSFAHYYSANVSQF